MVLSLFFNSFSIGQFKIHFLGKIISSQFLGELFFFIKILYYNIKVYNKNKLLHN